MARSRTRALVFALFMSALLVSACGGSGEEQTLIRTYFQAVRFDDRASFGNIAMYAWNTQEQGAVSRPAVESVSEEQRRPLLMKDLNDALAEARQTEEEFTQEKIAYQDENFDAINRVLEAEQAEEDVRRADEEIQEAWTDWRNRTMEHSKMVADALAELAAEQNEAELSMFDPNNPLDLTQYNGELVTKEVQITARVDREGNETEEAMTVLLQRAILMPESGGEPLEGRWVVRDIS